MSNNKKDSGSKGFFKARNTKRGAASIAVTILVIAAIVLLNIVTGTLSTRYSLYADMTSNGAYRLQDATARFASTVEKDTDLYVLANENVFEGYGDYYVQANRLIRQLSESSGHINLKYIDLTTNPTFPAKYPDVDWSKSHLCLVVCGDRYRIIDAEDMFDYELDSSTYTYVVTDQHIEQALASAIMNVTSDNLTKVSLLTGQQEEDMTPFVNLLTNNAYDVQTLDLVTGSIPYDSEFLIIYAPAVDIDEDMTDIINKWLDNNGQYGHHLIYFPSDKHDTAEYPNLNSIVESYGMSVSFGYIYETDPNYKASTLNTALCSRFLYAEDDNTFTKDLPNPDIPVYLYYTMPIEITDSSAAKPLLTTSEKAFFGPMTDEVSEDFTPEYTTLNGAAIGRKSDGGLDGSSSSVVVIGSYDALSEGFLKYNSYNNAAYFVNIFNTLSESESAGVIIEGKKLDSNQLGAGSTASVLFISVLVRWIIPFGVLAAGLIIFFIRRHR